MAAIGLTDEVERLRGKIQDWIGDADGEMREALSWQFEGRSKYFRPVTVFSCYMAAHAQAIPDSLYRSALVIELFHNVSLIIDDILDRSRYRRNKLTLHCRFGKLPALMAAGYITADGFEIAVDDPYDIRLLSELMKRLGAAECLQWRLRQQPLGVEDWRKIAGEDTGSMFEVAACLGARDERLRRFGHLLGMLYHGCDDVGDVRGAQALGGGGDEDLRDGILTLPAALAIRDPAVSAMFCKPTDDNIPQLAEAFTAQLPAAEAYLDGIAAEARREADLFASDPSRLHILIDHTRALAHS